MTKWVTLSRKESDDFGTFGTLQMGDKVWSSGELPDRWNENKRSSIPVGIYTAILFNSPRLGQRVYQLQDVPGRSNIEIHIANFFGDVEKGYQSDSEGCISVGKGVDILTNHDMQPQKGLIFSRKAYNDFMKEANGEELVITIKNEYV